MTRRACKYSDAHSAMQPYVGFHGKAYVRVTFTVFEFIMTVSKKYSPIGSSVNRFEIIAHL